MVAEDSSCYSISNNIAGPAVRLVSIERSSERHPVLTQLQHLIIGSRNDQLALLVNQAVSIAIILSGVDDGSSLRKRQSGSKSRLYGHTPVHIQITVFAVLYLLECK
ncbi:hypothetical protein D3C73_1180240 [compost metagenome]